VSISNFGSVGSVTGATFSTILDLIGIFFYFFTFIFLFTFLEMFVALYLTFSFTGIDSLLRPNILVLKIFIVLFFF